MPGCAAVGCHNRSEKGFIMKCFPRDPTLRKLWQERVARADWEPSNNSFLCHVHFDPDEWSITQSGRIRLKKNAVPSIFHITSTRKSLKKRTKLAKNIYATEYLVNDTEHSSIGQEKDSDSQDAGIEPFVGSFHHRSSSRSPKMTENNQDSDMRNEKSETSNSTSLMETSHRNEDADVKVDAKRDLDQNSIYESYDEIEEKLKQICDGYREENASPVKQRRILERSQVPLHRSINYKYSSRNEIGEMLADNTGNIEIIFGSESGDEWAHVPKCASRGNEHCNETEKPNRDPESLRVGSNPENRESEKPSTVWITEGAEEAYDEENITPIRAAMKRKCRTRNEIMQSIKKSIRSTASSQGTTSLNHSDTSDNVAGTENDAARSRGTKNATEGARSNKDAASSSVTRRFTVKVTGDADDVVDIMQDLFKDTNDFIIEKHGDADSQQDYARSVTSIITIDDCHPLDEHAEDDERDGDALSRIPSPRNHTETPSYRPRQILQCFDEPLNELEVNDCATPCLTRAARCKHLKLQEKVKLQENVIKKLTEQLLVYKDIEKYLSNKNLKAKTREMENLMGEFNGRSANGMPVSSASYTNADPGQRSIDDLSSGYFEELNKKLMKTINVEYQQKRKLESHIKQRDNQIKELNWKLEKASKFLERAEKNTNTYRRKMLNMQTFMRRKKLVEEQMSRFSEMLIDSAKEGYSEKTLALAKELKEICGMDGYSKLLDFGFPLPILSALQEAPCENPQERVTKCPATKPRSEATESTRQVEIALDNTETITGTVQDIFDENNDEDDFSTNELREHFILQLNAVM